MRAASRGFLRILGLLLPIVLGLMQVVPGQDSPADQRKLLTPEASLNLRSISDLQFSPDGARVAFVVTEPPKGSDRVRHVWV
jgi:hypothetical protein